jgi:predicted esterase
MSVFSWEWIRVHHAGPRSSPGLGTTSRFPPGRIGKPLGRLVFRAPRTEDGLVSRLWVAILVLTLAACAGEPQQAGEEPRDEPLTAVTHVAGWEGAPLDFAAWLPASASEDDPAPLIVSLHGCCATDMTAEKLVPSTLQEALELRDEPSPFILLEPLKQPGLSEDDVDRQVRRNASSGRCDGAGPACMFQVLHDSVRRGRGSLCFTPADVHDFLAFAVDAYPVDPDRVYLLGFSCGGFAVWDYLGKYGGAQLAARVVLAGDGRPALADSDCRMAEAPVRAFHGEVDDQVPLAGDQEVIDELLRRCPEHSELELDLIPRAGHAEAAPFAYYEADLWDWLLDQERAER